MRGLFPPGVPPSKSLAPDVVAGLTAATIVIPQAAAHATLAGVPVQIGLCTCIVPTAVYAFCGSSRTLIVCTTSMISILVATAVGAVATQAPEQLPAAVATLTALVGATLLVAGVLRLGFLAKFISQPVLVGFQAGLGLVIVVKLLPKMFGVRIESRGWLRDLAETIRHVPETSWPTFAVGFGTVAALVALRRFAPRAPAALIALSAATVLSAALSLEARGVATLGAIPTGLPDFAMPDVSLVEKLWPAAVGIALMSFTGSIASARTFTTRDVPRPVANRELIACGAANALGGVCGAMPSGGGNSQTAVNVRAGAVTQMSALTAALVVALTLLFLAPVLGFLPDAALSAVVLVTSAGLVDVGELARYRRYRRLEFTWALAATAGVIVLGAFPGIVVAILLSLIGLIHVANTPPVYEMVRKPGTDFFRPRSATHPGDESYEGLLIVRTDGRVHFGNVEHVGDRLWAMVRAARPKVLLIDCSAVVGFEYTALERLAAAEEKLAREGVELWLAALTPEAIDQVQRSELGQRCGRPRLHFTVARAVDAYQERFRTTPQ